MGVMRADCIERKADDIRPLDVRELSGRIDGWPTERI